MAPGHENREWESLQQADRSVRTYFRDLTGLVSQLPYNSISNIVSVFLTHSQSSGLYMSLATAAVPPAPRI